jgi:SAM-dependent methyltransferase
MNLILLTEVEMSIIPNYDQVTNYFEESLNNHGASAHGVGWNSETAQELRFSQLIKIIDPTRPFSLLDYGSGYGALADYLLRLGYPLESYTGFDVLESMVVKGREIHRGLPQCSFSSNIQELAPVDFAITSGIFNLKLETPFDEWTQYVTGELHKLNDLSRRGFSFNMLTKYSDPEYLRPDLYYADPCTWFDYCKSHFSRNVALLHDYEIYDFTILVRK